MLASIIPVKQERIKPKPSEKPFVASWVLIPNGFFLRIKRRIGHAYGTEISQVHALIDKAFQRLFSKPLTYGRKLIGSGFKSKLVE